MRRNLVGRRDAAAPRSDLALSIVVVAYDIARELPRTLHSLSGAYQQGVSTDDYEVIVVDNGSPTPVDPGDYADLDGDFRFLAVDDPSHSPARAVNAGLAAARGKTIGILLDGARLTSPGMLRYALAGARIHDRAAIVTHGWYVGYDYQREAIDAGWTTHDEDALLASIDWPNDGYRLFEISTPDDVSLLSGWWEALLEASLLFLPSDAWDSLGGYDERFDSPGGGLVNLDLLRRATELNDLGWVVLLGEATFHQIHGGIATNANRTTVDALMKDWMSEYWDLRGEIVEAIKIPDPVFLATFPCGVRARYAAGLNTILYEAGLLDQPVPPPVPLPDPAAEADPVAALWLSKAVEAARRGHETETMTFARWARQAGAAPSTVGPLLSHVVSIDASIEKLPATRQAQFHLAAADVHLARGEVTEAHRHFRAALDAEPECVQASVGLEATRGDAADAARLDALRVELATDSDPRSTWDRADAQLRLRQLHETRAALAAANADIAGLRSSRVMRWTAPLRRAYGRRRSDRNQ